MKSAFLADFSEKKKMLDMQFLFKIASPSRPD